MFYKVQLKKDSIMSEVFSLACSVYRAIQQNSNILISDSTLFDLNLVSEYMKKYRVHLFEEDVRYELIAFFFGKGQQVVDLTEKVPSMIPVQYDLNLLAGDPARGQAKEIFMACSLNGVEFSQTYQEGRSAVIYTDLKSLKIHTDFFWLDKVRLQLYDTILKSLVWKMKGDCPKGANVIHVLSPEDIEENRKKDGHPAKEFYAKLLGKYKEILSQHVSIHEPLLVVQKGTSELEEYLVEKGYQYTVLDCQNPSSFSTAIQATGTLVGNFHLETLTGSSTSYYLHTVSTCRQSIMVDLDNLYD